MDRTFVLLAASFGFLGVAIGAFGAHGLKSKLTPDMMAVFETGVQYHMFHVAALLGAAWASSRFDQSLVHASGWAFAAGIVIFSGSLYALAVSGVKVLGAITPIGGLAFLAGWALLFVGVLKSG